MIDLHTHTNNSDGSDDVITLLKKAEEKKIECLSITDHDNCIAYNELKNININEYYSGKLIKGVELTTLVNGVTIELLGYGINTDFINKKVKEIYLSATEIKKIQIKRAYDICMKIGVILDNNILNMKIDELFVSSFIHKNITKYIDNKKILKDEESWKDRYVFYRKHITNPKSPFFLDLSDIIPSCGKIVNLIKKAGGLVFIPHIYMYGENSENVLKYLIDNYKIDGIECYYSSFNKEQTNYLLNYCKNSNLYISGGSDYHGDLKPEIDIGVGKNNLDIPYNILNEWIDKVI
ncbi:MAG: PHP domain-containing protein [Clostridia bacterium]|nr:PHP domain-containing protein [Clostridia bacterium]MDD4386969.1 PHP domain-containing protein [Clostridia bacterium]